MIAEAEKELSSVERKTRSLERVLLPLIGASVALFVGSVFYVVALRTPPFSPLSYSTQQIARITDDGRLDVPEVHGVEAPSVYVDELVPALGDVCNDSDDDVKVSGSIYWERLTPRGYRVEAGRGTNEIPPGCRSLFFENAIPDGVVEDVLEADEPELWQITGRVEIDEPNGGSTQWRTEEFWIVPRESDEEIADHDEDA